MSVFRFKQFEVKQEHSAMKVGTDAMLLGSLIQADRPRNVLDVGTGTGVLALMMAQNFSEARITGIEVDEASASEAASNFQNSSWADRLDIIQADFLTFNADQKFDLIVSNPPYYQSRLENQNSRKAQARHESALPMADMVRKVTELLTDDGTFWVIVPSEVHELWIESAVENGLSCATKISIQGKKGGEVKRNVLEFRRGAHLDSARCAMNRMELTIRNIDGTYTDQYIELTEEFHFNNLK